MKVSPLDTLRFLRLRRLLRRRRYGIDIYEDIYCLARTTLKLGPLFQRRFLPLYHLDGWPVHRFVFFPRFLDRLLLGGFVLGGFVLGGFV